MFPDINVCVCVCVSARLNSGCVVEQEGSEVAAEETPQTGTQSGACVSLGPIQLVLLLFLTFMKTQTLKETRI